ncbi:hypothetical protein [Tychonema sp. LEGE 06208]|uniref:hypothetical protein n=1 Tax=Tychonema sp. LEGE 06208 TaxID=1828663 RepID=UPI001880FA8E|nr:hypothetical protein [Tychonema sp. LEGE 06208]MBE9161965.1 hypothetical protein [Tychonema sp. LEGE 06208]
MIVRWEGARSQYNYQLSWFSQPHPQNSTVLPAAQQPSRGNVPMGSASTLRANLLSPS